MKRIRRLSSERERRARRRCSAARTAPCRAACGRPRRGTSGRRQSALVVGEADPGARRDQVGRLERQQQRPGQRDDAQPEDDHHRRRDEQPGASASRRTRARAATARGAARGARRRRRGGQRETPRSRAPRSTAPCCRLRRRSSARPAATPCRAARRRSTARGPRRSSDRRASGRPDARVVQLRRRTPSARACPAARCFHCGCCGGRTGAAAGCPPRWSQRASCAGLVEPLDELDRRGLRARRRCRTPSRCRGRRSSPACRRSVGSGTTP